MSNRSLFSIALFFSLSFPAFAESPAPVTNGTTAQTADDGTKAPEGTATTPAEKTAGTETSGEVTQAGNPDATKTETPAVEEKPAEKAPEPAKAIEKKEEASHGDDEHAFTIENMWKASSGPVRIVLGTLLFMLVAAMGVGLERFVTLMIAKSQSRKVAGAVGPLLPST